MMRDCMLTGRKLQVTAWVLLLVALLADDWSPVLLLVIVALVVEWRQNAAARRAAEVRA